MEILESILQLALTAAPWLLIGLFLAGLIKAWVPMSFIQRWVGGNGLLSILRSAVLGAPLPLCSCGAIPTAFALHRNGAGRGPMTAFLVGAPGVGVDSVAMTYALLGPFMAVARVLGALVTAIATGLLVTLSRVSQVCEEPTSTSCGDGCGDHGAPASETAGTDPSLGGRARLQGGLRYAFRDILDDIMPWVVGGLILAGAMTALVPEAWLASLGDSLWSLVLLALVGVPLYICAAAATPIAAGLLLAGVSPGAALVFLLAGPVTSLATLGALRQELGTSALVLYLTGVVGTVVLAGLMTDWWLEVSGIAVLAQLGAVRELLPVAMEWSALVVLSVLTALRWLPDRARSG